MLRAAMLLALAVSPALAEGRAVIDFGAPGAEALVSGGAGATVAVGQPPEREGVGLRIDFPTGVDWPHGNIAFPEVQDWSTEGWFTAWAFCDSDESFRVEFEFRDASGKKYKAPRQLLPRKWTQIEVFVRHMSAGYDAGGWAGDPIDVAHVPSLGLVGLQPPKPWTLWLTDLRIERPQALAAPALEAVSVGEGIGLHWQPVEGADEYWLYRANGEAVEAIDASRLAALRATRFVDTEPAVGSEVCYAARAFSFRNGEGPLSAPVTHTRSVGKRTAIPDRDRWGGMLGVDWEATGYFRTEKRESRWWLVDPEGHPWFGLGICVVGVGDTYTRVTGREERFERWLPTASDPTYRDAWTPAYGYGPYGLGDDGQVLSPYVHGLIATHGTEWKSHFVRTAEQRMAEWGLNYYGAWVDGQLLRESSMPYVTFLSPQSRALGGLSLPDPFDPAFVESAEQSALSMASLREDPRLVGVFSANEIEWYGKWQDGLDVVDLVQAAPDDQPARVVWLERLRERYATIAELNASWKTTFADWGALAAWREDLPPSAGCASDKTDFFRVFAERYFRICYEVLNGALPNHLYLGVRIAGNGPEVVDEVAARYCDVMSYNTYPPSDAATPLPTRYRSWSDFPDVPLIIGEFSARGADAGLPNTKAAGSVVPTQADRGWFYQRFLSSAFASPNVVGVSWFQYIDEPLTGRFGEGVDGGENSNMGWVDVDDRPWEGMVRFARTLDENLYVLLEPR